MNKNIEPRKRQKDPETMKSKEMGKSVKKKKTKC